MEIFIMLSRLTDEGRKTVKMRPERIKEVNIEIEKMGAKVLEQYAVLGEYDFVNILEAPDNETISRVSIELGARGTIQLITLAAISIDQLSETFVLDEEMRKKLAELNPKASLRVANRLLEAHERDYWQPDQDTLDALRKGADELEDKVEGVGLAAE